MPSMISTAPVVGWDIGGAHLKAAAFKEDGCLSGVVQEPCPLWQGTDRLERAVGAVLARFGAPRRAAVTMTGELVDLFDDRAAGVRAILTVLAGQLPASCAIEVYAGPDGFITPDAVAGHIDRIASANWLASVAVAAGRLPEGLFIDIGSTTTDLVPFHGGVPAHRGYTDAERLAVDELVYTGAVRTPVMAVAARVPFAGEWQGVMAEHFATMADVHRLTGDLPGHADQLPSADGRDKSPASSARRLLRMIGRDLADADHNTAQALAAWLAEAQLRRIHDAAARILSRGMLSAQAPVIGAGVGRFLARRLAGRLGRHYRAYQDLPGVARRGLEREAGDCVPAVAVGLLALAARPGIAAPRAEPGT